MTTKTTRQQFKGALGAAMAALLAISLLPIGASAQRPIFSARPQSPSASSSTLEAQLDFAQPKDAPPERPAWAVQNQPEIPFQAKSPQTPSAIITSTAAGGNWSAPGTWVGGVVPTAADDAIIANGATVTIDTAALCLNLTVGQGASGILQFLDSAAFTLTAGGNVLISAGGTFRSATTGTVTTHVLQVGGNLTNNGTLDFSTNGDTAGAGITFAGAASNTFSGTGATTDIRTITMNKGTSPASILDVTTSNFTVQGTTTDGVPMAFLTLTNGTFKMSGSFTLTGRVFTSATYTIPLTAGFWLNNANVTVAAQTGSVTNAGLFRLSSGNFNVGTALGDSMGTGVGAVFNIAGGTMNVAGRLSGASTFVTYTQSAGTVNVSNVGNATSSTPAFGFTGTTAVGMNISGGTINLVQASTAVTPVDYNQTGTMNFTGGTLNVGTAATATNFLFRIQGQMPAVVLDVTTNNKNANLSGQGNVWGNLAINPGTILNLNGQTLLQIGPAITNNGAITVTTTNTGSVNFAGQLQTVGAPYAQNYSGTGTCGAAALRVASFSLQNPLGITISGASPALNVYRINAFFGQITGSGQLAIGAGDAVLLVIQRGVSGAFAAGSFDAAPVFNVGSAGLAIVYSQASALITTGPEIPATRSILSIQILNPTNVTLAGGALTATGTAAGLNGLFLSSGTLNTSAANLLTLSGTVTAAISGGTAASYVNGPLARTLPASLVTGSTYTFPVGKSSFKMLELVNPTTNSGGTVVVQAEAFDANSGGTAGAGFSSLNTNRYWSASVTPAANFTDTTVRLTEVGIPSAHAIGQSATQGGTYNSIGGTVAAPTIGPSSTVTSLGFFAIGVLTGAPTISGSQNVGPAGAFPTISAAAAAYNSRIQTGPVTFLLTDTSYTTGVGDDRTTGETFPITINGNPGASATNTLTIKPAPATSVSISPLAATPTAVFILNGADWVTIDGSNTAGGTSRDLTITNTNISTTSAVIWGQTTGTADPATNNTVKNVNIAGNAATTTLAGVGFAGSAMSSASLGTRNDNNRVQNCNITAAQFGIFSEGASATNKNFGTVITGNQVGGAGASAIGRVGIFVGFDDGAQVTNNSISNVTAANSFDVHGIAVGSFTISTTAFTLAEAVNATITGNFVSGVVKTDTFSAAGITFGTATYGTTRIANNMVSGVNANGTSGDFAAGIFVGGSVTGPVQLYFNSVSMTGARDSASLATSPSFALAVLGSNPVVDIRDNVLYNTQTSATAASLSYAIGLSSIAPFTNITSNFNDFFTSGASAAFSRIGSLAQSTGVDLTTLAAWQASTGKDANSISADPLFVNSLTDLHVPIGSPVVNVGTAVGGIVVD
ncbi:MAG: hypothetical protein WAO00_13545, partial [Chthoniobacterales bacterium]